MTSKQAQCSTKCRFWILKISCQIGVLKKSQSALFGSAFPHGNTVCIHMYDDCKRSNDIFVCHKRWSILWSIVQVCSLTIEYQVFQYVPKKHFRTIWGHTFWQFSHGFQFFFFEMMVINAWSWYFVALLSRLVCQLTISFNTFLGMTFHIVRPRRKTQIFRAW